MDAGLKTTTVAFKAAERLAGHNTHGEKARRTVVDDW
jgi:hypothetical protein